VSHQAAAGNRGTRRNFAVTWASNVGARRGSRRTSPRGVSAFAVPLTRAGRHRVPARRKETGRNRPFSGQNQRNREFESTPLRQPVPSLRILRPNRRNSPPPKSRPHSPTSPWAGWAMPGRCWDTARRRQPTSGEPRNYASSSRKRASLTVFYRRQQRCRFRRNVHRLLVRPIHPLHPIPFDFQDSRSSLVRMLVSTSLAHCEAAYKRAGVHTISPGLR
jgi:hypothetical protein